MTNQFQEMIKKVEIDKQQKFEQFKLELFSDALKSLEESKKRTEVITKYMEQLAETTSMEEIDKLKASTRYGY